VQGRCVQHPGRSRTAAWATACAAAATVVIAVGADAVAGGHPLHTAALAIVTGVLALLRLHHAGRHRAVFALTSGAIVSQPALHAAMAIVPAGAGHAVAERSVTVVHVVVAAMVVTAVIGAEHLFLIIAATPLDWLRLVSGPLLVPERPGSPMSRRTAARARWCCPERLRGRAPPATGTFAVRRPPLMDAAARSSGS
jgi:hypothetical protein